MIGPACHAVAAPDDLRRILERARTIAVVGASSDPWRPSFGIFGYLKRAGYRCIPVNPHEAGRVVHGETFVAALGEIGEPIDLVNVFRRPDALPALVEEVIAIGAPVLWTQLGVSDDRACARAQAAGIEVVMNRCISVEHARLRR